MSIEHDPSRITKQRRPRQRPAIANPRLAFTINEFCAATSMSRASAYRAMQAGVLKYVEINGMRRIPASECERLGLTEAQ